MPISDGCMVCGEGPWDGHTALIRQNEKGVAGIWACEEHDVTGGLEPGSPGAIIAAATRKPRRS